MKKIYVLLGLCLTFVMSSCSVLNKSTNAAFFEAKANVAPVEATIDVDDSKKIKGSSKSVYLLGILRIAGDNKYADGVYGSLNPLDVVAPTCAAAAFKAIKSSGAELNP